MTDFLTNTLMSNSFIPHGHCYLWQRELVGLHLVSDLTIAIAYFSIPLTLFYFVQQREDLPFNWIFTLFGAFIIFCGTTHLLEVWTLWHPVYWLSGAVKAMTAIVSAYTAFVLVRLIPQALSLPSPAQLAAANLELQQQIQARAVVEAQIQQLNEELEAKVAQRTQELVDTTLQANDLAERLNLSIDAALLGTWDWNLLTDEIAWNDYCAVLLDDPDAATYTYSDWEQRIHPDDLAGVLAAIEVAKTTRTDYAAEYRVVRSDGSWRWLSGFGRFYRDRDQRPVRMAGVISDITDRKQDEIALRRSEEFTRRMLEYNHDCIKVLDLEGRLLYMNDGGKKLLEIDNFETIERSQWSEYWQDADRQAATVAIAAARSGQVAKFEGNCPTVNGKPKWWEVTVTPLLDASGNIEQLMAISHDLTERIQAELSLKDSEEQFRATFEQAAVGIAHVAIDGAWLRVNQRLCEILGYTQAELLARTFQEITDPEDLATDLEYVRQLVAGEIPNYVMEKRYLHKSGEIVWTNLTVSLRCDAAGVPLHFISAIEDIRARKHSQTELARANALAEWRNQELERFSYIVSHDLKAPLRGIANLAQWIEDDLTDIDPDTQANLELLRSRVDRMEAMINGLLDYARLGNLPSSLETFAVDDLLAEVVDSLNIPDTFRLDLPDHLPKIATNRILLGRVLANLIGNAYKHHDRPQGKIRVTARPLGNVWEFTVADDGAGIPAASRERIFEIFQTLSAKDKNNTGIGLSIVKRLVETHGGEIAIVEHPADRAESSARGTTFRFTWAANAIEEN